MSSPYVKLGNRTLDQWRVTELREELKKRKLTTKGLKEELVKRLDEVLRMERENAEDSENDENDTNQSELPPELAISETNVCEGGKDFMDVGISMDEKEDSEVDYQMDDNGSLFEGKVDVSLEEGTKAAALEEGYDVQAAAMETTAVVSETIESVTVGVENSQNDKSIEDSLGQGTKAADLEGGNDAQAASVDTPAVISETIEIVTMSVENSQKDEPIEDAKVEPSDAKVQLPAINESRMPLEPSDGPDTEDRGSQSEALNSSILMETVIDNPMYPEPNSGVKQLKHQIPKVDTGLGLQLKSDSVSTDSVSITKKVELMVSEEKSQHDGSIEDPKVEPFDRVPLPVINESLEHLKPSVGPDLEDSEAVISSVQMEKDDLMYSEPDSDVQQLKHPQVPEGDTDLGLQLKSNSVSTESVSITEKVDLIVCEENSQNDESTDDAKTEPSDEVQLPVINDSLIPFKQSGGPGLEDSGVQCEALNSSVQMERNDPILHSGVQQLKHQVPEVYTDLGFEVKSDSVSTDSSEYVSITEKGEPKVDVITYNAPLEPNNGVLGVGEALPIDIKEPLAKKETEVLLDKKESEESLEKKDIELPLNENVSVETIGGSNEEMVDSLKNMDVDDLVNEKLNLDRSSGDDSMEEDIVENKIDENLIKSRRHAMKEKDNVDVVSHDKSAKTRSDKSENEAVSPVPVVKRKFHDIPEKALVGNNDPVKKARRWNAEVLKSPGSQSSTKVVSAIPKGLSEPAFKRPSEAEPRVNEEAPKERIVPPSSIAPTNSLRIDRFLRPFTLKQVQELLGQMGNVTGFWMDHIKTHCYVSFSSVEEAVGTRNAVYNLQWPPNGGRQLVAEFADPQEVKTRLEVPLPSPATPSAPIPPQNNTPPQPSPRQQAPRAHQLPPPPPPPLLATPPPLASDHLHKETLPPRERPVTMRERLPPPPPLAEKAEPPMVTLDDLFCKTKATPRIYYMPLSDADVAAKSKEQGKNVVN